MQTKHSDQILEDLLSLHPKLIDLTLDRIWALLDKLGNPQDKLPPVVHIAGTNGKGSTLAFIQAIAEAAGLKTHRYSSPHLIHFHERIILAGQIIPEPELAALLAECQQIQGQEPITFFEITTAAALLAFSRTEADILLLETGLGGRLDATNVIANPAVNILSPISIDHQDFLGQTLQEIATEKIAIARTGVPLVTGKQPVAAMDVIKSYAKQHNVPTYIEGHDWFFERTEATEWQWSNGTETLFLPQPSLVGAHQYNNAALAISAIKILQKQNININNDHIQEGLTNTFWAGRMHKLSKGYWHQKLPDGVEIWVDGGHNVDAAVVLSNVLQDLEEPRIILGMLSNKDCSGFLNNLEPYLSNGQSITIPNETAAYDAATIAEMHSSLQVANNFKDALQNAVKTGGKNIIICGSLYLVGAFLAAHEQQT